MRSALGVVVEGEHQRHALVGQRRASRRPARPAPASSFSQQVQAQFLAPQLADQRGLVFHQHQLALVDDADAVGHLLGFLDVVRGEDDGHAAVAQLADAAATCRGAVPRRRRRRARPRNSSCGSCTSALAIITRRFMPPESVMILASRLSHSDRRAQHASRRCAAVAGLAEQAAAEASPPRARFRRHRWPVPAAPGRSACAWRAVRARCRGRPPSRCRRWR